MFACIAMAATAATLAAATAQDAAPQTPVFRAGVELVRLDVRVTDADGRSIPDLRQSEVEVVEGGRSRPVVFFQHIEQTGESYADVARRTVASEVSTNQGAARGHLYVLVFDQQHIPPGGEQRARMAAERFITTRLKPGDRVGLYALPGPGPALAFSADKPRLIAELQRIRGLAEPQAAGVMGTMTLYEAFQIVRGNEQITQRVAERVRLSAGTTDIAQRKADSFYSDAIPLARLVQEDAKRIADIADGESRRVLATLADVLRPMRAIDGRKTILLVSEGFNGDRLTREVENVAAAAAQSYSVVYSLDINRHEIDAAADNPIGGDQANEIQDRLTPMGSIAAETGGRLLIDAGRRADDIFTTLAAQAEDYYLVGFTPSESATADRDAYRRVTVRVTRRGALVSTRTGFTLTDAAARMDRHQAIERAMSAPFAQQGLPLEYTTYQLRGDAPGLQHVILALGVELPIAQPNAASAPPADVAFVVRSAADGRIAASGHDVVALPAAGVAGATTGTGVYRVQFDAPPGEYVMRAVVREPGGLVGSADRRFTIRALDGPSLTSGDLIVSTVRGELPVRPTAYVGDGLSGVVELYGRTSEQLHGVRVVVDLMPAGESGAVVSGTCDLQDVRPIAGGLARAAHLALPLAGVPAGAYVARARVMAGPDTVAEAARAVDIRPGRRPTAAAVDGDSAIDAFDPREVVNGAFARDFAARLIDAGPPVGFEGTRGLDRLGARDYPSAIAAFETVLAATPGADKSIAGPAAFLLGWAYHGAGDDRQAISAWRRAAFVDPTIVPAHLALADMYLRLAQPALAIQALRAGLAAVPQSPELNDRLSRIERR